MAPSAAQRLKSLKDANRRLTKLLEESMPIDRQYSPSAQEIPRLVELQRHMLLFGLRDFRHRSRQP